MTPRRWVFSISILGLSLGLSMVSCTHHREPRALTTGGDSVPTVEFGPGAKRSACYFVDGRQVGEDIRDVVAFLQRRGVRRVVFRSGYKMIPGHACENYTPLREGGVEVLEFWVPTAFTPGGLDLMKSSGGPCG